MAIKRQVNFLGNMRVDVPHLRLLESAVAADFQSLSGVFMAGSQALIGSGVVLLDTGMAGQPANTLVLRMANASLLHGAATEPGGIFTVPATQPDDTLSAANSAVVGSFAPNVTNYIALDLVRTADATTQDTVIFRSTSTKLEFPQVVPLGRVLNYTINISTSNFGATPTLAPVAKVLTDVNNNIVSITDCRQMFFRLGSGGTTPDPLAQYVWANRNESASTTLFGGGDKDITSQHFFNRAIQQRLWELGGGEHWYSPADDRSVKLVYTTPSPWVWDGANLTWTGIKFIFGNSTAGINSVTDHAVASPGLTDLADNEVIYVDLNRTTDAAVLTPHKVARSWLFANPPALPGTRHILAWRTGTQVFAGEANNDVTVTVPLPIATNLVNGGVLLNHASGTPLTPKVAVINASDWAVASGMDTNVAGVLSFGTVTATSLVFAQAGVVSTFNGSVVVNGGAIGLDVTGSGAAAIQGTSSALSSSGIVGIATGTAAVGVLGYSLGANGIGVRGDGSGASSGIEGHGGSTNGTYGVYGTSFATNGGGVHGLGTGTGYGVYGVGGATAGSTGVYGQGGAGGGDGVYGLAVGAYAGVVGQGGPIGVHGFGTATGVTGSASGTGSGVEGSASGSGAGVYGNSATGWGGQFTGNATKAAIHLEPFAYGAAMATPPTVATAGDIVFNSSDNKFYGWNGTAWSLLG